MIRLLFVLALALKETLLPGTSGIGLLWIAGPPMDRKLIRNTIQNLDDAIAAHEAKIAALKAR